jgi:hypothetical protein
VPAWCLGSFLFGEKILVMRKSLIWSFLLLLTACFRTREVEPPSATSSDWVSPTDHNILLANLTRAVNQQNVQNYLRCFAAEKLRYLPATQSYTGNQIIWDSWSWQDEQTWFSNLKSNLGLSSGNSLSLSQVDLQAFSSDSLRYIGNYDMVMNHTDTSLTVRFIGQLEFLCKVNAFNEWEIARWTDFETHPDSSWSRLKLNYVQ